MAPQRGVEVIVRPSTPEAQELARAEAQLAPCNADEAMELVFVMIGALPVDEDADEAIFAAAFRIVVSRYPLWAVRETACAFIGGLVASHWSTTCPNTAVFGRELERRVGDARMRLATAKRRADERMALDAEPARTPRPPELKALGDAAIARLRDLAALDRLMRMRRFRRDE